MIFGHAISPDAGWLRLLGFLWVVGGLLICGAAEGEGSSTSGGVQTVEQLTRAVRPSVVVVSHEGRAGKPEAMGSGFVVSTNGLVATSLHVIGEARPIRVRTVDGKEHEVTEVYAWDRKLDLAIVRIDPKGVELRALELGDSDILKQGAAVVAMGNPLGLEHSVVQGVVSATREFDGVRMIQLAIPIEEGNSGGPLLDLHGRVHGILTLKSLMSPNLGFAMPVNDLKGLLEKPNRVPMSRWLTIGSLNPQQWRPVMGARWIQRSGKIEVQGRGEGFGGRAVCLSATRAPMKPYELSVVVRMDDESGAAGLIFEADEEQRHYGFYPSAGQLRLTRFDGPNVFSWKILAQVQSEHYRPGDWNEISVRVEEEKIICSVNGQAVIESTDDRLRGPNVGLAKFRQTQASFKRFRVGERLERKEFPEGVKRAVDEILLGGNGRSVSESTLERLEEHRAASWQLLLDKARQKEDEAERLRDLAGEIHRRSVERELTRLFELPEEKIDLMRGALLLARLDDPELELEPYLHQVETMALEIKKNLSREANDEEKLKALTTFFVESGFHGSRTDYYNRANSYLSTVLDDREGQPITLSVLFLELARQIELGRVTGVSLPKHFMVKYAPESGPEEWIDVFDGARRLSRTEASQLLRSTAGVSLTPMFDKPARKRDILIRMLRNLLNSVPESEGPTTSLRYYDLIVALAPEEADGRMERARARIWAGDAKGAKEDLKHVLKAAPPGVDLERITELIQSLE